MMQLLNFVPDIFFHLLLIVGVLGLIAGYLLNNIPFISTNAKTIQVVAILVTVVAVWFEGGISRDKDYREQIAELQVKIAQAEKESAEANTRLVEQLKENEKLRKEKKNATQTIVNQVVSKYDGNCVLSNAFIRVHDSASQDKLPEGTRQSDGDPSNVKPSEVLNTVIDNYESCYNMRDKLIKWQEWYKIQRELFDKAQ